MVLIRDVLKMIQALEKEINLEIGLLKTKIEEVFLILVNENWVLKK